MKEIWKDVVDFEGIYKVSNLGNVISLDRYVTRNDGIVQFKKGKNMNLRENDDGYLIVHLSKNGKGKYYSVHTLVAKAFIPNPDNLPEVNHIDFNRKNNVYTNLNWMTHKENVHHTIKAGRHNCNRDLRGSKNPNYRNHTLRDFYKEYPEIAAERLSRPGSSNGRAKKIIMIDQHGKRLEFSYMGECCKYLIANNYTDASVNSIRNQIRVCINNNTKYKGLSFRFK